MEVNGDENDFYIEWKIENFCCWNKEVHSPAISTNGLRIGELVFDLSLFPRGFSGDGVTMVLQIYDDTVSHGELLILAADRSETYGILNITEVRVDGFMIIDTEIMFQEFLYHITRNAWHEDTLILEYHGKSRRPFYHLGIISLKSTINVFDSSCIIPSENIVASLLTEINSLANIASLQDEDIGHFKMNAYCTRHLDTFVRLSLSLEPEQIIDETLVHCYIYIFRNESSIRLTSRTHIFTTNETYYFSALLLLNELTTGTYVTVRLKIVSDKRVYSEGYVVRLSRRNVAGNVP